MTHSPAWPFPRTTANSPTVPSATDRQTLASRGQAPSRPACVRIRGARCLCSECGDYVTVAHIVRGERKAFCGRTAARFAIRGRRFAEGGHDAA
jgi:hypothetical protein